MRRSFQLVLCLCLLYLSQLACGLGSSSPRPAAFLPTRVPLPTESLSIEIPPAVPESRMLTLEFPPAIRAGDSDVIRLTLELDDSGNITPTVSTAGNQSLQQVVIIPNVYETHNVLAEARLDMAGLEVRPSDVVTETLLPGQKVTFYWSILPVEVGKYKGTVWFFLHFVPKINGIESRQAISAQVIQIEATSFFGLRATVARWLGIAGTFISSILGMPFLESILKWLWKRIRGQE